MSQQRAKLYLLYLARLTVCLTTQPSVCEACQIPPFQRFVSHYTDTHLLYIYSLALVLPLINKESFSRKRIQRTSCPRRSGTTIHRSPRRQRAPARGVLVQTISSRLPIKEKRCAPRGWKIRVAFPSLTSWWRASMRSSFVQSSNTLSACRSLASKLLQISSSNNLLRSISSVTYAHNADADSSRGDPKVCSTLLILLPARSLCAVSLVLSD